MERFMLDTLTFGVAWSLAHNARKADMVVDAQPDPLFGRIRQMVRRRTPRTLEIAGPVGARDRIEG
jgi:hypothetical protein